MPVGTLTICNFLYNPFHVSEKTTLLPYVSSYRNSQKLKLLASYSLLSLTRLMAAMSCYPNSLRIYVTVIFFFCFISTTSVSLPVFSSGSESEMVKETKMRLGSRPPRCVNRCSGCKPCVAVLVAAPHRKSRGYKADIDRGDESYYLLSWKCKCGDRYFQP